jgi:hypothetical protein
LGEHKLSENAIISLENVKENAKISASLYLSELKQHKRGMMKNYQDF